MLRAMLLGGLAAGVGDSVLALVLYRVPLSVIYQSVAAGLLGRASFSGGLATAALGMFLHFSIGTIWAGVYVWTSRQVPVLARKTLPCGLTYGVLIYFFMKYVVLQLSAVTRLGPFEPAAMIGHAFLVGLPIAFFARR